MLTMTCDSCAKPIDRDRDLFFGVDFTPPAEEPLLLDELSGQETLDGVLGTLKTLNVTGDSEYHFCSPECLSTWAFGRTLENQP